MAADFGQSTPGSNPFQNLETSATNNSDHATPADDKGGTGSNYIVNGPGGADYKGMRVWQTASNNPNDPSAQGQVGKFFFGNNAYSDANGEHAANGGVFSGLATGGASLGKSLMSNAMSAAATGPGLYKAVFSPNVIYPVSPSIQSPEQQPQPIQAPQINIPAPTMMSDQRMKTNITDGTKSVRDFLDAVYKMRK